MPRLNHPIIRLIAVSYTHLNGIRQTGWQKVDNKWYYLKEDGVMATGWLKLGNVWYFLNGGGVMQTGWLYNGGVWYYLYDWAAWQTPVGYRLSLIHICSSGYMWGKDYGVDCTAFQPNHFFSQPEDDMDFGGGGTKQVETALKIAAYSNIGIELEFDDNLSLIHI